MKARRMLLVAIAAAVAVVSFAAPASAGYPPGSTQTSVFSDGNRDW